MNEQKQYLRQYLQKNLFDKQLKKLAEKYKKKKIVLYGAGLFFEVLNSTYDLSALNIIAISDKKFENSTQQFLGYNTIPPSKIKTLNPDIVLITTEQFVNIAEYLVFDLLDNTTIKVKPILELPFLQIIKMIWDV